MTRILALVIMCLVIFLSVRKTLAADFNSIPLPEPPGHIPSLKADNIFQGLPSPLQDFVNSAKQINQNITEKSSSMNVKSFKLGNLLDDLNSWLRRITGFAFTDIVRGTGNLFVWFFGWIASLIRWGLSFI